MFVGGIGEAHRYNEQQRTREDTVHDTPASESILSVAFVSFVFLYFIQGILLPVSLTNKVATILMQTTRK